MHIEKFPGKIKFAQKATMQIVLRALIINLVLNTPKDPPAFI